MIRLPGSPDDLTGFRAARWVRESTPGQYDNWGPDAQRELQDRTIARYELAEDLTGHHHHLVCSNCGRVEDLPATAAVERSVAAAIDQAARRAGFRTQHHRLDLVGVCSRCAS